MPLSGSAGSEAEAEGSSWRCRSDLRQPPLSSPVKDREYQVVADDETRLSTELRPRLLYIVARQELVLPFQPPEPKLQLAAGGSFGWRQGMPIGLDMAEIAHPEKPYSRTHAAAFVKATQSDFRNRLLVTYPDLGKDDHKKQGRAQDAAPWSQLADRNPRFAPILLKWLVQKRARHYHHFLNATAPMQLVNRTDGKYQGRP